jgi:aldehyde dehydrogenase (NAD+)
VTFIRSGANEDNTSHYIDGAYSGVGREYGRYGIEAFLETRPILES